ncbi:MAG: type II toxin-antitoxin system PemK/MazF family toxin [Saprospiraceae bacterium]
MSILKWHIYRANLDPVIGSEQGKTRPVLVISEDTINSLLNIVNVLPLTSLKPGRKVYPNEAHLNAGKYGQPNDSIVLCHQIRTLDKRRLTFEYGKVDNIDKQEEITEALCFQLGIARK